MAKKTMEKSIFDPKIAKIVIDAAKARYKKHYKQPYPENECGAVDLDSIIDEFLFDSLDEAEFIMLIE